MGSYRQVHTSNLHSFCLRINNLKKKRCCSHCDQKNNEELSIIVCRQRLLRKCGHPLMTRIFPLKVLVGRCVLLHKTKASTCEDKVRLFYAIKITNTHWAYFKRNCKIEVITTIRHCLLYLLNIKYLHVLNLLFIRNHSWNNPLIYLAECKSIVVSC